jgi:hypothetical protein
VMSVTKKNKARVPMDARTLDEVCDLPWAMGRLRAALTTDPSKEG